MEEATPQGTDVQSDGCRVCPCAILAAALGFYHVTVTAGDSGWAAPLCCGVPGANPPPSRIDRAAEVDQALLLLLKVPLLEAVLLKVLLLKGLVAPHLVVVSHAVIGATV